MILDLIANPSFVVKSNLSKIHSSYCGPLRHGLFILRKSMLVIKEPIKHSQLTDACGLCHVIYGI